MRDVPPDYPGDEPPGYRPPTVARCARCGVHIHRTPGRQWVHVGWHWSGPVHVNPSPGCTAATPPESTP